MRMAKTDTFSYDPKELLSQVSYGVGGSSTMTWDADQQRQKLTNSGGSEYFVYDPTAGVPAVLVETDGENETFYVREPGGELIARATGQTRQYYFFDRLGSTVAMVPAVEGNPTDRLFYTPWGELVTSGSRASTVGTTANPYRYVGQLGYYYHHQDAGLADWMQLGVRFYRPELGRFERRDEFPSAAESAFLYSQARGLVGTDPSGLSPIYGRKECQKKYNAIVRLTDELNCHAEKYPNGVPNKGHYKETALQKWEKLERLRKEYTNGCGNKNYGLPKQLPEEVEKPAAPPRRFSIALPDIDWGKVGAVAGVAAVAVGGAVLFLPSGGLSGAAASAAAAGVLGLVSTNCPCAGGL